MNQGVTAKDLASILDKAREGNGLFPEEVKTVLNESGSEDWQEIFRLARIFTRKLFFKQLHFFVPLYFSSFCINDCAYCGFRRSNRLMKRKSLTPSEFLEEARFLWEEGHRSLLLVAGEHPTYSGVERIAEYLKQLKKHHLPFSTMVEVGSLNSGEFRYLNSLGAKQYLLFQETYHPETYERLHCGTKKDFSWRYGAAKRALQAGIEKVGLGILLGLHDYREDLTALIRHAWEIKEEFGLFPETLSFPRLRPAAGVSFVPKNEEAVSDEEFEKLIAVTRVALPSVGIVLSTREESNFRDHLLRQGIGITHLSAGSSTLPGGYTLNRPPDEASQFELMDHRPLKEVVKKAQIQGYLPVLGNQEVISSN